MNNDQSYPEDYRHFDSLIWQVPAWSTGIFGLSMTAVALVISNIPKIQDLAPIDPLKSLSFFLCVVFLIQIILINVYLRFRLHQRMIHRPKRKFIPAPWFLLPAQFSLLLLLFIEAAFLLHVTLITGGISVFSSLIISSIFFVFGFAYVEFSMNKVIEKIKAIRDQHELPR